MIVFMRSCFATSKIYPVITKTQFLLMAFPCSFDERILLIKADTTKILVIVPTTDQSTAIKYPCNDKICLKQARFYSLPALCFAAVSTVSTTNMNLQSHKNILALIHTNKMFYTNFSIKHFCLLSFYNHIMVG